MDSFSPIVREIKRRKQARHIYAICEDQEDGSRIYRVDTPLFFASVHRFGGLFDPAKGPDEVYIDCAMSRIARNACFKD